MTERKQRIFAERVLAARMERRLIMIKEAWARIQGRA